MSEEAWLGPTASASALLSTQQPFPPSPAAAARAATVKNHTLGTSLPPNRCTETDMLGEATPYLVRSSASIGSKYRKAVYR